MGLAAGHTGRRLSTGTGRGVGARLGPPQSREGRAGGQGWAGGVSVGMGVSWGGGGWAPECGDWALSGSESHENKNLKQLGHSKALHTNLLLFDFHNGSSKKEVIPMTEVESHRYAWKGTNHRGSGNSKNDGNVCSCLGSDHLGSWHSAEVQRRCVIWAEMNFPRLRIDSPDSKPPSGLAWPRPGSCP